jgi:hypothetical protein
LLVNSSDRQENIIIKLLALYEEHNKMSLKIIELLTHISSSIEQGDGSRLEKYALIEKEFTKKLLKTKRVISSFEKNCGVYSVELNQSRSLALSQQESIMTLGKNNRTILKDYLKKLAIQIENISRIVLYSSSFSKQSNPQFIDLKI